ncbi:MAG: hypothetical protein LCH46_00045 [Proteobacteria bacterium]|nr:hypothetical protein [Pseudomonadota bacterium]
MSDEIASEGATSGPHSVAAKKLIEKVEYLSATEPYEFDGSKWAMIDRKSVAVELGISVDVLAKIINLPPFVFDVVLYEGKKGTLLRLGPKGPPTFRTVGKAMGKVWGARMRQFNQAKHSRELEAVAVHELKASQFEKEGAISDAMASKLLADKHSLKATKAEADSKIFRRPSKSEFGCLVGLAEIWGIDCAVPMLVHVIRNWSRFMVQLKLENALNENLDQKLGGRYYEFPNLAVMRKHWWIGFDLVLHDFQECFGKTDIAIQTAMLKVVDGKGLAESPHKAAIVKLVCSYGLNGKP